MEKKRILLEDEVLYWLQIWQAASSLNVKRNKATKKDFFHTNQSVSPNMVTCVHDIL